MNDWHPDVKFEEGVFRFDLPNGDEFVIVPPQIKELSDDELNKAFDYYCETDEGVLRFNYELRDEWKKEQLIRWKEAFKKASEK